MRQYCLFLYIAFFLGFFLALWLRFADCYEETAAEDELKAELSDLNGWLYLVRMNRIRVGLISKIHDSLGRIEEREAGLDEDKECKSVDNRRQSFLYSCDDFLIIDIGTRLIHLDQFPNKSVACQYRCHLKSVEYRGTCVQKDFFYSREEHSVFRLFLN